MLAAGADNFAMNQYGKYRKATLHSIQFGWWMLLVFLTMGIVLEAMHGFKWAGYLDQDRQVRRLMWRESPRDSTRRTA